MQNKKKYLKNQNDMYYQTERVYFPMAHSSNEGSPNGGN
jgi:hypothetical protein